MISGWRSISTSLSKRFGACRDKGAKRVAGHSISRHLTVRAGVALRFQGAVVGELASHHSAKHSGSCAQQPNAEEHISDDQLGRELINAQPEAD